MYIDKRGTCLLYYVDAFNECMVQNGNVIRKSFSSVECFVNIFDFQINQRLIFLSLIVETKQEGTYTKSAIVTSMHLLFQYHLTPI